MIEHEFGCCTDLDQVLKVQRYPWPTLAQQGIPSFGNFGPHRDGDVPSAVDVNESLIERSQETCCFVGKQAADKARDPGRLNIWT